MEKNILIDSLARTMTSLYQYPLSSLRELFHQRGLPPYGADQIYHWIYKRGVFNPEDWSNVGAKAKAFLREEMDMALPRVLKRHVSEDGTCKYLLGFADGQSVECVTIPAHRRLSLCLSSQIGCAIGCTFCHTGTMGLTRHLTASEIVGQYLAVQNDLPEGSNISNIVYMGQGEPLHNFENVRQATLILMEEKGIGLGQRKITLSTSGLVPQIEKLGSFPPVNVAISLHSTHNPVRDKLMPINKRYDLERLFQAIATIPLKPRRKITYEYLLIKDLNDGPEDILGLKKLLNRQQAKINLIPFNEYPGTPFQRPDAATISRFQKELINAGYVCTLRATKGDDILAACGQLKHEYPTGISNSGA